MIKFDMDKKYEEIVEVVERKIWMEVSNNMQLREEVREVCKSILIDGNTGTTEKKLVNALTDDESQTIQRLKENIGNYMIKHIIDKNYMDDLLGNFESDIIQDMIQDIKDGIVELSLEEVLEHDVIEQGHMDNLIDEETIIEGEMIVKTKTWHSRMTVEDGMSYDNEITVEIWINGNLEDTLKYEAI